jgi:hypothetical protein
MSNDDASSGEFTVHELVLRVKRSRRVPSGAQWKPAYHHLHANDNDGNRAGEYLKITASRLAVLD